MDYLYLERTALVKIVQTRSFLDISSRVRWVVFRFTTITRDRGPLSVLSPSPRPRV